MSNAARKARKRAGIPFAKTQKVGTPLLERAWATARFPGLPGTRYALELMPRSAKKLGRAIVARGGSL